MGPYRVTAGRVKTAVSIVVAARTIYILSIYFELPCPPKRGRFIIAIGLKVHMTKMVKKSFDAPDEIRSFDKSKIVVLDLGDVEAIA